GHDVAAGGVQDLVSLVVAEAGHPAVGDRDVGLHPLAREDGQDAAAADDEIGRLAPAGDGETAGELDGHGPGILSWESSTLYGRGSADAPEPRRGPAPEGRAARGGADPGRNRPHGRAQLRPRATGGAPEPERGRGAA